MLSVGTVVHLVITIPTAFDEVLRPVQVLGNQGSGYGSRRLILNDSECNSHDAAYPLFFLESPTYNITSQNMQQKEKGSLYHQEFGI